MVYYQMIKDRKNSSNRNKIMLLEQFFKNFVKLTEKPSKYSKNSSNQILQLDGKYREIAQCGNLVIFLPL